MADALPAGYTETPIVKPPPMALPPGYTETPIKSGLEGPTSMRAGPGPIVRGVEAALPVAGAIAGMATGNPMVAAAGMEGGDLVDALANRAIYGTPTDITPKSLQSTTMANAAGAYGGEMAGPLVGKALSNVGGQFIGKPGLEAGAIEAAEGAERTAAKAAESQGQKNLAERTDLGQKVTGATQQAQDTLAAHQTADAQAAQNMEGLKQGVAQKLQPEARDAAIQGSTGVTPAQTQQSIRGTMEDVGGVKIPGSGITDRQTGFWNSVYNPIHKMSSALGDQYDTLFKNVGNKPIGDASPLTTTVADERAYAASNGINYSSQVNKLLERADSMAQSSTDLGIGVKGGTGAFSLRPEQLAQVMKEGGAIPEPATIQQLRGLRSDASAAMASATDGRSKAAAQNIVEAADDALLKSNVLDPAGQAKLLKLNQQWRSYKTIFDRNFMRKIGSTAEPTEAAGEIFNDPKRFSLLVANADKDGMATLRSTYADWINVNGSKVVTPEQAPELAKLFPGTPLADPKGIIHLDKGLANFDQVLKSSPQVAAKAQAEYATQLGNIHNDVAKKTLSDIQKYLPSMGNTGRRIMAQMKAAKSPSEAIDIATKALTDSSPEQIAQEEVGGLVQKDPSTAGREAIMAAQSDTGVSRGMKPPTTPEEAGVQALQTGRTGGGKKAFMTRIASNWPIYMAVTGMYAAQGRNPSPYMAGMAVMGGTLAALGPLRGLYLRQLADNPEMATRVFRAITSPGVESNFKFLMNTAAKGAIADAAGKFTQKETGATLEGTGGPGPAVKALDTTRAGNIAPHGASSRAEDLIKDMSKGGKPTDVHNDLTTGRLSLDELKKALSHTSKANASAMLDHVSTDEAIDAAVMGTDDEKRMLIPLIQAKMRADMGAQKGNRTQQAALAKRMRDLQASIAPDPDEAAVEGALGG